MAWAQSTEFAGTGSSGLRTGASTFAHHDASSCCLVGLADANGLQHASRFLAASGSLFLSHFRFFAYDDFARWCLANSDPRHAWPDPSMRNLGGLMKTRDLVLLITLPIGLLIGVSMLSGLADSEMAQFFDHLVMSGIIAYGVVYCFFM